MDSYSDEHEYGPEHIPMFQKVMDMFEGKPDFQRIVRLGILANMGYDVEYDTAEDCEDLRWVRSPNRSGVHGYGFSGTRESSCSPQARSDYYGATTTNVGSVGASKEEEKAERKRLKRQKRKEKKRNEKQKEKEQQSKEEKDEKKAENEKPKVDVKEQAAASESGGGESEDDLNDEDLSACEELDMTSTFVSKARSKLEQKPKPEKEKKIPAKESKSSPEKPKRDAKVEKKPACPSSQSLEENIRISTQFANLGNTYAEAGNFKVAVQYYTDAIKHNLINYKLFGNRSFCFERMRLYMKALDDAEVSLTMHPGWVKGLFRKGKALAGLKRYEEAERAFRQVLEADSSYTDAAHELMRVQVAQLMGYGYTAEQSVHALSAQKTVKKALHFLGSLNHQATGVRSLKPRDTAETAVQDRCPPPESRNSQQRELYPIWVGNLFCSVTESSLEKLFSKVGPVDSVRLLTYKRCAFVNFTKRKDCEEAIRMFNGFEFYSVKIAVRYPDRIPAGMGMSSSALTS